MAGLHALLNPPASAVEGTSSTPCHCYPPTQTLHPSTSLAPSNILQPSTVRHWQCLTLHLDPASILPATAFHPISYQASRGSFASSATLQSSLSVLQSLHPNHRSPSYYRCGGSSDSTAPAHVDDSVFLEVKVEACQEDHE